MTTPDNKTLDASPDSKAVQTYCEAVQIIAESLNEFSNLVCTPEQYVHNAKAILARLSHADITVEKILHGTDEDNVDGITKYRAAQRRLDQWGERNYPLAQVAQTVQQLADHQAALLKTAAHNAAVTRPVPGWPVVITSHTDDVGYFATMRRNHPVKLGDTIDGKLVVATCWEHRPGQPEKPVYRLDGETAYREAPQPPEAQ